MLFNPGEYFDYKMNLHLQIKTSNIVLMKRKLLLLSLLIAPLFTFAIKYYQGPTPLTSAAWNTAANWSTNANGTGTHSVPGVNEEVRFHSSVTISENVPMTAFNNVKITGAGQLTIAAGVTITGGNLSVNGPAGSLTNNGTATFRNITYNDQTPNTAGGNIVNNGSMTLLNLNIGNGSLYGLYTNNGTLTVTNNIVVEEGQLLNNVGSAITSNGLSVRAGGIVTNNGTYNSVGNTSSAQIEILDGGTFNNGSTGVLNSEMAAPSVWAIRINGNFNNDGTVNVGPTPPTSYVPNSQGILVQVSGDFYSSGSLNFNIDPTNCVINDNHGANGSYLVTGTNNHINSGLNCTDLILPIQLVSFTGTNYNGLTTLNWKSAIELNANRYEVQFSENGSQFTQIGVVAAKGASIYKFDVNQTAAVAYYRLKMVDNDGKFSYSNVVRVEIRSAVKDFEFFVTPNIIASNTNYNLVINAKTYRGLAVAKIVNSVGAVVNTVKINVNNNNTVTNLNAGSLAKGMYFIQLQAGNNKPATQRLIIQ